MKKAIKVISLLLLWIFKYKFNTDNYLIKFKAHLCIRDNLQIIKQKIYTVILTV